MSTENETFSEFAPAVDKEECDPKVRKFPYQDEGFKGGRVLDAILTIHPDDTVRFKGTHVANNTYITSGPGCPINITLHLKDGTKHQRNLGYFKWTRCREVNRISLEAHVDGAYKNVKDYPYPEVRYTDNFPITLCL